MNTSMISPSSSQLLKSDAISPSLLITTQLLKTQYQTIKQMASARIESSILICDDTNTHMILNCWSISVVSDVEQISDLTAYYWWPDDISHGYKHDLSIERRIVKKRLILTAVAQAVGLYMHINRARASARSSMSRTRQSASRRFKPRDSGQRARL